MEFIFFFGRARAHTQLARTHIAFVLCECDANKRALSCIADEPKKLAPILWASRQAGRQASKLAGKRSQRTIARRPRVQFSRLSSARARRDAEQREAAATRAARSPDRSMARAHANAATQCHRPMATIVASGDVKIRARARCFARELSAV